MVFKIDTRCLAILGTSSARGARIGIDADFQEGKFTQIPEDSAYRTKRVAVSASASPRQISDNKQRENSQYKGKQTFYPDFGGSKRITLSSEYIYKKIIDRSVNRTQQLRHYSSRSSVRIEESRDNSDSGDNSYDKNSKNN